MASQRKRSCSLEFWIDSLCSSSGLLNNWSRGEKTTHIMNSMKLVILSHFISWKKTPNDAVTPQHQSQFTPKMKANTEPRLLLSLVWIDYGVVVSPHCLVSFFQVTAPIIFGEMHFHVISENEFFHEIKRDERTSFMDFTKYTWPWTCVFLTPKQSQDFWIILNCIDL